MRTTASYDLFPDAPSERAMARARWLAREGRVADAETAYRSVLATHPDLTPCWAEYFELLRTTGRAQDALRLAEGAEAQFGSGAFPLALKGAALIELARFPDALAVLERAVEADPDLALVWHELGYAAYRLGDRNRALLALDRAFGLEPHTETLKLRGRILREAGRYTAAEGAVVLAPIPGPVPPSDEALAKAFVELAQDSGWRFGQVVAVGPSLSVWAPLAEALGAPLIGRDAVDPRAVPLVAALRPLAPEAGWAALVTAITEARTGLVFVLEHSPESPGAVAADVIGVLSEGGGGQRRSCMPQPAHALAVAQHPGARIAGRRLRL